MEVQTDSSRGSSPIRMPGTEKLLPAEPITTIDGELTF
jgi:hypothetical protein